MERFTIEGHAVGGSGVSRRRVVGGLGAAGLLAAAAAIAPGGGPALAQADVTEEEAIALTDRLVGRFNAGDLDAIGQLLSEDLVVHWPWPVPGSGPEHAGNVLALFREAFPDATLAANEVLVAGDRVIVRATVRGTHDGALFGVPATGRLIGFDLISIGRVADGRIAELWAQADLVAVAIQLGGLEEVLPAVLGAAGAGADADATPLAVAGEVEGLLELEGVAFAVAFGPDGTVTDWASSLELPEAEVRQAAQAGPTLSALLAVAAERYGEVSALEWAPPVWALYSGPKWTAVLTGNMALIAETETADFNQIAEALGVRGGA